MRILIDAAEGRSGARRSLSEEKAGSELRIDELTVEWTDWHRAIIHPYMYGSIEQNLLYSVLVLCFNDV